MITINDKYNLVSEMFEVFNDFEKSEADHADVDVMLITSPEAFDHSKRLTVLIDPEPNIQHGIDFYLPKTWYKPNCLIVTSGYNLKDSQYNLYPINSALTVKNNPGIPQVDYTHPKSFLATALLGCWSLPRGMIIQQLQEQKLLEKCIVNYYQSAVVDKSFEIIKQQNPEYFFNYRSPALDEFDHTVFINTAFSNNVMNTCRPLPGSKTGQPSWISQLIPWNVYRQTYLSIVAETDAGNNVFFMSEKISKPLLVGHPFVVYGCQGYLAELRNLGFKTFSPWLNEEYDLINNKKDRIVALIDSVLQFSSLPEHTKLRYLAEMKPILDHNRQLISDKHWLSGTISKWIELSV